MMNDLMVRVSNRRGNPDGEKISADISRGIWGLY